jgi:hypothetical protein
VFLPLTSTPQACQSELISTMPDQPQTIKHCDKFSVHPTPRRWKASIVIQTLETKAAQQTFVEKQQQSAAQAHESSKRRDSAVSLSNCGSPVSEPFESPSESELLVTSESPDQISKHFSTLGSLEAGLNQETSRRNSNWSRIFCQS